MSKFAKRTQSGSASFTPVPMRGPISYPNLSTARAALNTPSDANYVMWNNAWPDDRDLEDIFALELASNDILVLPERAAPYVIDSSEGFRAAGVQSVTGRYGQLPIINRYMGIRGARTWFAMARARRGILGLGPNARIEVSQSAWTQEPQIQDAGSVQEDGWVSPGRYWTNTSGVIQSELVGCQEKIIEAAHATPYFGNFTLVAHDMGGVAFGGILGNGGTFERLQLSNSWRGFLGIPNGEAGAIASGGSNPYYIRKCILGTRDTTGVRVGTSPIMINSSTGGGIIEDTDASETKKGMLTIWNSSGVHILRNVNCHFNDGPGLNLEKCNPGFELQWLGGSLWSDYYGNGDRYPKPVDQGTIGRMHISMNISSSSVKVTVDGVDIDQGPTVGKLNIQAYGTATTSNQLVSDVTYISPQGVTITPKIYGIN